MKKVTLSIVCWILVIAVPYAVGYKIMSFIGKTPAVFVEYVVAWFGGALVTLSAVAISCAISTAIDELT